MDGLGQLQQRNGEIIWQDNFLAINKAIRGVTKGFLWGDSIFPKSIVNLGVPDFMV